MKFADLHCHPHMRAYMWLKANIQKYEQEGIYHPWTIVASNMNRWKNAQRATGYAQGDMVKLWNGKVRLVFNSIYPFERGFFISPSKISSGGSRILKNVARVALKDGFPIRNWFQGIFMRLPLNTIANVRSKNYDYWKELQEEYNFIIKDSGKEKKNEIILPGTPRRIFENRERKRVKHPDHAHAEGIYIIPKTTEELQTCLDDETEPITMILTVEGAHVFDPENTNIEEIIQRIRYVKTEWEYPLFFITLAHHFNNFICGHAMSFPDIAKYAMSQDDAMNEGFTEIGWAAVRELLSLTADNEINPEASYRILIDMKHMSALSRLEYYNEIIRPCYDKGDVIPVVLSHAGYSGVSTLQEMIDRYPIEGDFNLSKTDYGTFYANNINFCDEDVQIVAQTGGLIGLCFDRRILGMNKKAEEEQTGLGVLWANLKGMLQAICTQENTTLTDWQKAWSYFSIGSDFDGYIDPVSEFKTTLNFEDFARELLKKIKEEIAAKDSAECIRCFDDTFTPELAVEAIVYQNAENFVRKHYPNKNT
ncbi:MAG: hypothetical protein MK212_08680 [Saprospiraceae bacterium]|nr:hypothetical protein [Saprospiraceae bacterium]